MTLTGNRSTNLLSRFPVVGLATEALSPHNKANQLTTSEATCDRLPQRVGAGIVHKQPLNELEFSEAFRKGFPKTLYFLSSRGVRHDLAEEVAQEAWVRGWERLFQLRNPDALEVWVASIARNLWRSRVVNEKRQEELPEHLPTHSSIGVGILWDQMLCACGPEERQLLAMYFVNGYTSREIGEILGCSPMAIRLRLMRVRRKLR